MDTVAFGVKYQVLQSFHWKQVPYLQEKFINIAL